MYALTGSALLKLKRKEPKAFDSEELPKVTFPVGQLLPIYITALVLLTAFIMMIIHLTFLLGAVAGATATQSGLVISGAILFSIPPSLICDRINKRLTIFTIVTLGFALFRISYPIIGLRTGFLQIFVGGSDRKARTWPTTTYGL